MDGVANAQETQSNEPTYEESLSQVSLYLLHGINLRKMQQMHRRTTTGSSAICHC